MLFPCCHPAPSPGHDFSFLTTVNWHSKGAQDPPRFCIIALCPCTIEQLPSSRASSFLFSISHSKEPPLKLQKCPSWIPFPVSYHSSMGPHQPWTSPWKTSCKHCCFSLRLSLFPCSSRKRNNLHPSPSLATGEPFTSPPTEGQDFYFILPPPTLHFL